MKKLLLTTARNGKDSNIYQLDTLKELGNIYVDDNNTYYFKDYQFTIVRVKNDINGNPQYKFTLAKNFEYITEKLKGVATRTYVNKNYAILQSHYLEKTLTTLFEKIENK